MGLSQNEHLKPHLNSHPKKWIHLQELDEQVELGSNAHNTAPDNVGYAGVEMLE